jgi:hypothetical protein
MADVTDLSFEEALKQPGDKVVGWNTDLFEGKAVAAVYVVTDDVEPERLAWMACAEAERATMTQSLRQRGFAVGEYDDDSGFLWTEGGAVVVWRGDEGLVLRAEGELIHYRHGRTARRDAFARVVAYVADDFVERGVRVELADGSSLLAAVDANLNAEAMPHYNRNDLLFDSSWAVRLGAVLAGWAGVPFESRI